MQGASREEVLQKELRQLPMDLPIDKQREMFALIQQQSIKMRHRRRLGMGAGTVAGIAAVVALALGLWNSNLLGVTLQSEPNTTPGQNIQTPQQAPGQSQPVTHPIDNHPVQNGPGTTQQVTPPQTENPAQNGQVPSQSARKWELVGKVYMVQGTILSVSQTSDELKSISLQVNKNIPGAWGIDEPFQVGAPVEVRFDQKLSAKGTINPETGDEIILAVGQYAEAGSDTTFFGSQFKTYYYQKNGKFYDLTGKAQEQNASSFSGMQ